MENTNIEKSDNESSDEIPLEIQEEIPKSIPTPLINEKPITIPKKKVKEDQRKTKPRSEKQKLAFEKLQRRRAEQVELIHKQKQEDEEQLIIKKKSKVKKKKEVIYESRIYILH